MGLFKLYTDVKAYKKLATYLNELKLDYIEKMVLHHLKCVVQRGLAEDIKREEFITSLYDLGCLEECISYHPRRYIPIGNDVIQEAFYYFKEINLLSRYQRFKQEYRFSLSEPFRRVLAEEFKLYNYITKDTAIDVNAPPVIKMIHFAMTFSKGSKGGFYQGLKLGEGSFVYSRIEEENLGLRYDVCQTVKTNLVNTNILEITNKDKEYLFRNKNKFIPVYRLNKRFKENEDLFDKNF